MPADLHLPEEILHRIVQCLQVPPIRDSPYDRRNLQTLARLLRVSKQLQRLTAPLLYRSFPGHRNANAVKWLSDVLARPDRAQRVRYIDVQEFARFRLDHNRRHLDGEGEEEDEDEYGHGETDREVLLSFGERDMGRLDDQHIPKLEQLISDTVENNAHNYDTLQAALRQSQKREGSTNLDLIMSLMVLACPNIKSIDVWICNGLEMALLPLTLASSPRNSALSQVCLRRTGEQEEIRMKGGAMGVLADMFVKRNVGDLEVTNETFMQSDITRLWEFDEVPPWTSMKRISLQDCKVPPDMMAALLRMCPSLKTLELKSAMGAELKYLEDHGEVLRRYACGLERLTIDAGTSWYEDPEELAYRMQRCIMDGVGSLRELTQLKEVEATLWTLLLSLQHDLHLVDILPPGLQVLTILPCITHGLEMDIDDEIVMLEKHPAFANLKIRVEEREILSDSDESDEDFEIDEEDRFI